MATNDLDSSMQNIDEYNKKVEEFVNKMTVLFGDVSKNSAKSIREISGEVEKFVALLDKGKLDDANKLFPDIPQDKLASLSKSQADLKKIREEAKKLREEAEDNEGGFTRMATGLKKVTASGAGMKDIRKGIGMLSDGFTAILGMSDKVAGSLRNIGEITGSGFLNDAADYLSSATSLVSSAFDGAKIGAAFGPVGAAIGGAVSLVAAGANMIAENKKHLDMLQQQVAADEEKAYLGEMEVNRLYRERYEWTKKTGETNLEYISRQKQAIEEMRRKNEEAQGSLLGDLHGMSYRADSNVEKTGLFGLGKGQRVDKWESLKGKDFDEIEQLALAGKLQQKGMEYYELLKKARTEGREILKQEEDILNQATELLTGNSLEGLTSTIVEAFKQGKRSNGDFNDTFEEILKLSFVQGLSEKLREPLKNWQTLQKEKIKEDEGNIKPENKKILEENFDTNIRSFALKEIKTFENNTGIRFSNKALGGPSPEEQLKNFNNYLLSAEAKLESDKLALFEDGKTKRLEQSKKEFIEKQKLLKEEFESQCEVIEKLDKKDQEASRSKLKRLYEEQNAQNEWEKTNRDAAIEADYTGQVEAFEKKFGAFQLSGEQRRQGGIRDSYSKDVWSIIGLKNDGAIDHSKFDLLLNAANDSEQHDLLSPMFEKFKSMEEKREEIIASYNEILTLLQQANEQEGGLYQGKLGDMINTVLEQQTADLAAHDSNSKGYSDVVSKLFEDTSDMSLKNMREYIDLLEEIMQLLGAKEFDKAQSLFPDFSIEQLKALAGSDGGMKNLEKNLGNLRTSADQTEVGFRKMGVGLKDVFNSKGDPEKLQEGLSHLSDGFSQVTAMGGMFADSLSNIGELTGSKALGSVADGIGTAMNVAGGAMQGAQAGMAFGPAGAAVGAAVGLASSVTKIFGENKKHREMLKQQIADNLEKEYFVEFDINRLYRERYEWTKKIGEATLTHLARQGAELNDQTAANAKEQDELWAKLMGEDYKSNEYFKKTGFMGWGKGKIVTEWTSLAGKSWEDIERLAASGKLSEDGMKYYEALKKAREEGEDLAKRQEEYLEQVRETFTGSSYESLVDSLIEGFKQGKRSAEDFADTFEDLMRGAVHSSLKLFLDESMRQWYEDWGAKAEDGLTEAEIEELRADYKRRIEEGNRKLEELENITGVSFSENEATQQASSKGFAAMSQDTGDELNGRFTALQMSGINLEQYALAQNQLLGDIRFDTATMSSNISLVNMSVDEIRDINRQSMNHLYKIEKNTALLNSTNELLGKVVSNTANL